MNYTENDKNEFISKLFGLNYIYSHYSHNSQDPIVFIPKDFLMFLNKTFSNINVLQLEKLKGLCNYHTTSYTTIEYSYSTCKEESVKKINYFMTIQYSTLFDFLVEENAPIIQTLILK